MIVDERGKPVNNPNNLNINIGPEDVEPISCKKCGCPFFIQSIMFGKISRIKLASDEDKIVALGENIICVQCGTAMNADIESKQDPKQNVSFSEEEVPEEKPDNIIKLGN